MNTIKYQINNIIHQIKFKNKIQSNQIINNHYILTDSQKNIFIDLKKILIGWIKIAKKYNIEWWLCSGSLLGAIRHKGFIPWDNDIDICVPNKHYELLKKIMKKKIKNLSIDKVAIGFRVFIGKNSFPYMDIWMVDVNNSKKISFCGPYHNEKKTYYFTHGFPNDYFYSKELYPLKICKFENIKVFIPNDGKQYLFRKYGENCLTNGIIYPHTLIHPIMRIIPLEYLFDQLIVNRLIGMENKNKLKDKYKISLVIIKMVGMITESDTNLNSYIKLLIRLLFNLIHYV